MAPTKALLIGINYIGTENELHGCANDVANMSRFLTTVGGYNQSNQLIMTEEHGKQNPNVIPTGRNMIAGLKWLLKGANPGDHLFLHYSGHGSQIQDTEGAKQGGINDTIVPLDFRQNGQLSSDFLHMTLVSPLPQGVRLTVVMDCCHSGSILELPFHFRTDAQGNVKPYNLVKNAVSAATDIGVIFGKTIPTANKVAAVQDLIGNVKQLYHGYKAFKHHETVNPAAAQPGLESTNFGEGWDNENKEVFCFSGCMDSQTSADANIGGSAVGAMSWALLTVLGQQPNQTYASLLQNTKQMLANKFSQVPQLSVGRKGENLDAPFRP